MTETQNTEQHRRLKDPVLKDVLVFVCLAGVQAREGLPPCPVSSPLVHSVADALTLRDLASLPELSCLLLALSVCMTEIHTQDCSKLKQKFSVFIS